MIQKHVYLCWNSFSILLNEYGDRSKNQQFLKFEVRHIWTAIRHNVDLN